jgi:serine/threonine protein kinase
VTVTSGTRLGVYEVTAQIGEGGMGQVFRATDTKLKHQVAIKILPPSTPVESAGTSMPDHEVVFLLNVFDERRRRVPATKRGDESMFVPKLPRSCRKAQP